MKTKYLYLTGIILCFLFSPAVRPQGSQPEKKDLKKNIKALNNIKIQQNSNDKNFEGQSFNQSTKVINVFNNIESAFTEINIETLVSYFSVQTYLNLPNGTNGYYSSNQAYFVLEDFLKNYRITSFKFSERDTSDINPFATGVFRYNLKGKRDSTHIYVQLRKVSKNWNITQITIN